MNSIFLKQFSFLLFTLLVASGPQKGIRTKNAKILNATPARLIMFGDKFIGIRLTIQHQYGFKYGVKKFTPHEEYLKFEIFLSCLSFNKDAIFLMIVLLQFH